MKTRLKIYCGEFLCCGLAAGCSTTKNLPEEEVLYTGIKEIDYGQKSKKKAKKKAKQKEEEGVITSLADAYKAVDDLLTQRDLSVLKRKEELTQEQKDSIAAVQRIEEEAYETAKEEVDAALAYAPNNALFGSSSYRIPFPTGLWIYNALVGKKSRFAKWLFDTFAGTPVFISTVNPKTRALVAQNTLRNYGYFNGTVDYEILPEKNPKKAKISYTVRPRNLFRLDSIANQRFPAIGDSLIRQTLATPGADHAFMIYHPALSYFARDYGLHQIPIEAGGKEPSPAHLKALIDTCSSENVHVIFVQPEFDRRNAELIAQQTGTRVVDINPLSYDWETEMLNIAQALNPMKNQE